MPTSLQPQKLYVAPQGSLQRSPRHLPAGPTWVLHGSFASVSMAKSFSITSIFK